MFIHSTGKMLLYYSSAETWSRRGEGGVPKQEERGGRFVPAHVTPMPSTNRVKNDTEKCVCMATMTAINKIVK